MSFGWGQGRPSTEARASSLPSELEFFCHTINSSGIRPSPMHTLVIRQYPTPCSKEDISRFLGFKISFGVSCLQRPNYSSSWRTWLRTRRRLSTAARWASSTPSHCSIQANTAADRLVWGPVEGFQQQQDRPPHPASIWVCPETDTSTPRLCTTSRMTGSLQLDAFAVRWKMCKCNSVYSAKNFELRLLVYFRGGIFLVIKIFYLEKSKWVKSL